jgi:hypothetical protein
MEIMSDVALCSMMDVRNRSANVISIDCGDDVYVMLSYIPLHTTKISVPMLFNALRS